MQDSGKKIINIYLGPVYTQDIRPWVLHFLDESIEKSMNYSSNGGQTPKFSPHISLGLPMISADIIHSCHVGFYVNSSVKNVLNCPHVNLK